MTNNPATLEYKYLEPGCGPRFGVSDSQSLDFKLGSRQVFAWFCTSEHAVQFAQDRLVRVWDLETGELFG